MSRRTTLIALILAVILQSIGSAKMPAKSRGHVMTFDVIEFNHRLVGGSVGYTQAIFWNWSPEYKRMHVVGWAKVQGILEFPVKSGEYYELKCVFPRKARTMRAKLFRETWTERDPEYDNEKLFPVKFRDF